MSSAPAAAAPVTGSRWDPVREGLIAARAKLKEQSSQIVTVYKFNRQTGMVGACAAAGLVVAGAVVVDLAALGGAVTVTTVVVVAMKGAYQLIDAMANSKSLAKGMLKQIQAQQHLVEFICVEFENGRIDHKLCAFVDRYLQHLLSVVDMCQAYEDKRMWDKTLSVFGYTKKLEEEGQALLEAKSDLHIQMTTSTHGMVIELLRGQELLRQELAIMRAMLAGLGIGPDRMNAIVEAISAGHGQGSGQQQQQHASSQQGGGGSSAAPSYNPQAYPMHAALSPPSATTGHGQQQLYASSQQGGGGYYPAPPSNTSHTYPTHAALNPPIATV